MNFSEEKPLVVEPVFPREATRLQGGGWLLDFGRVAFAQIELAFSSAPLGEVEVRLGEKQTDAGRVDIDPPGSVRAEVIRLRPGSGVCRPAIPYRVPASKEDRVIRMPEEIGEVMPFRWVEVLGADGELLPKQSTQLAVHYPFTDDAANFHCDNDLLNRIWDLCHYTMKATSFCGLFVDGDRERYPREGDGYVNQLGWFCTAGDLTFTRRSLIFMLEHSSHWVEYLLLLPMMAWEDYLYTGDRGLLEHYYDALAVRSLREIARPDGLIVTDQMPLSEDFRKRLGRWEGPHVWSDSLTSLIDWPRGLYGQGDESNGYEITPVNTVCNAFHYGAQAALERIAGALGRESDAEQWRRFKAQVKQSFSEVFFDIDRQVFRDGEGSGHTTLHANAAALRFGLADASQRNGALACVKSCGMACSVYFSQYLLEMLYQQGEGVAAFDLLTSAGLRSWANMLELGATITHEAWDPSLKPVEDWNHPWGAAPANILPRWLAGIRPLEPGWRQLVIAPQPGPLRELSARVPTVLGPVELRMIKGEKVEITIPSGCQPHICIPDDWQSSEGIKIQEA